MKTANMVFRRKNDITITIIGAGNMGSAIIQGCLENKELGKRIHFNVIDKEPLETKYAGEAWIKDTRITSATSIDALPKESWAETNFVLDATKPYNLFDFAETLKEKLPQNALFMSIVAGGSAEISNAALPGQKAYIQIMPNRPAALSMSYTGIHTNSPLGQNDKDIIENIVGGIGIFDWYETAKDIDAVTAISGSGPGYVTRWLGDVTKSYAAHNQISFADAEKELGNWLEQKQNNNTNDAYFDEALNQFKTAMMNAAQNLRTKDSQNITLSNDQIERMVNQTLNGSIKMYHEFYADKPLEDMLNSVRGHVLNDGKYGTTGTGIQAMKEENIAENPQIMDIVFIAACNRASELRAQQSENAGLETIAGIEQPEPQT